MIAEVYERIYIETVERQFTFTFGGIHALNLPLLSCDLPLFPTGEGRYIKTYPRRVTVKALR
jgi:hypothetical protein